MRWPTTNGRPIRRATFGHAATYDEYLIYQRQRLRAGELGQIDWLLHRRNCNPWRKGTPAHGAYNRSFIREMLADPNPSWPPIPDLPRARQSIGKLDDERPKETTRLKDENPPINECNSTLTTHTHDTIIPDPTTPPPDSLTLA